MTATITKQATQFEVGDGATVVKYSDRNAGTIVEASAKKVVWQRDTATLLNGPQSGEDDALVFSPGGFVGHTSGTQRYEYAPDPDGVTRVFTLRKNGRWVQAGEPMTGGPKLVAGRSEYYDFNF
jgi:hypothetical protein